jgi:hypothetical protein
MKMEKVSNVRRVFLKEEYPRNLLLYIGYRWEIELPTELTSDILAGINYAISLLDSREQQLIRMRFMEGQSLSSIGKVFGVKAERVRQIETRCVRRLRMPDCHEYICHGIHGTMQRRSEIAYKKGFDEGYKEGYRQALDDAEKGVTAEGISVNILSLPIECLCMSSKTCEHLRNAGYDRLRDLLNLSEKDIQRIKGLTVEQRFAIAGALSRYGLFPEGWHDYYIVWKTRQNQKKENKNDDNA